MGALMLVLLLAALDQTIVATALPRIARELNGLQEFSWVATAYLLASGVSTPLYGKISDLLGRKKIFQFAILLFLTGSVLCGLSQNMTQLVFFRALQGLGAGGLMTLVMTIVGDIVPPRERGRYMGYLFAVFGLSSVVGPLLGGFLTDSLSWRWVFFVNVPLGAVAFYEVTRRLHLPVKKLQHKIDYLGAGLLSSAIVSLLLATVWGGNTYAWSSPQIIGLFSVSAILTSLFIWCESRAKEPVIPLGLFKNDIFTVSALMSLFVGITMFASILYIPLYQQLVRGYSPTESGLLMLPLVGGILGTSIIVGWLITKIGHYKIFPIIGNIILALGIWLFSHLSLTTPEWELGIWMFIIGVGLGMFMQVTTLAIQNAVDAKNLGVATSTATFFRSTGAAIGAAVFGTILTNRLTIHLRELVPKANGGHANLDINGIKSGSVNLHVLPPEISHNILLAFVRSFHDMFLIALPFVAAGLINALFLREKPLRTTQAPPVE
ncbi:MAG TPA: MDR family MFS transporter [Candidatus Saccharimonadales bacterium]|nr:MDR family MFS transporter [Candidatus Saccharimonadales bacterium]